MRTLILFALTFLPLSMFSQDSSHGLESFAWLVGCWKGTYANGRTVTEQWTKPRDNVMTGTSRTLKGGSMIAYEDMRLVQEDDGRFRYIAHPSGQAEATFLLVRLEGAKAVFENPEHDFPQRIIYERVSDDSLMSWIEGTINGVFKRSDFPFARTQCD